MKLTHKQKVKIARRGRTRSDIIAGTPLFQTLFWDTRKESIRQRAIRTQIGILKRRKT